MVLEVLRTDEALQIDEILDLLETQLTSSEVFTALFELEIAGRVRCMPGRITCVRCERVYGLAISRVSSWKWKMIAECRQFSSQAAKGATGLALMT